MGMTTVVSEHACVRTARDIIPSSFNSKWQYSLVRNKPQAKLILHSSRIRACNSMANNNKKDVYNQVVDGAQIHNGLAAFLMSGLENVHGTHVYHFEQKAIHELGGEEPLYKATFQGEQDGVKALFSSSDTLRSIFCAGLFSLRRKIEDAVHRADLFASAALEMEEARRTKHEEMARDFDLWDDPAKSNDILVKLANSAKLVDSLKDLRYKVEEAKLIQHLAEMNAIDYGLYKQAYNASLDASKIQDQYEMCKLLKGPFDVAGACLVIKAGCGGIYPKIWAEQLLSMYLKWAKKQGYEGRIVDRGKRSSLPDKGFCDRVFSA